LAAQIRALAETDVFEAINLASRGKMFSQLENLLNHYYETVLRVGKIQAGQKSEMEEISGRHQDLVKWDASAEHASLQKHFKEIRSQIAQMVMDAIDSRNTDKIFELAKAVEFLREFEPGGDPIRARILLQKHLGHQWTISELAKLIDWPDGDRENGFPHLRRLCKELNYQFSPASQIGKK
jgi:hypothetical protein